MFKFLRLSYAFLIFAAACLFVPHSPLAQVENNAKDYYFTTDWFTGLEPLWRGALYEYIDKPDVNYLEIGVFEGRSAIWMLENVLTHPTAKMTAVDLFDEGRDEIFIKNLEIAGASKKVKVVKGFSQEELRKLPLNSYDIIYIDASHVAKDVFVDIAYSWHLLKDGGIMIFDDYRLNDEQPFDIRPKISIDAFLTVFVNSIELLHRDRQVIVRKIKNPCNPEHDCSAFDSYVYLWRTGKLMRQQDSEKINLSDEEKSLLEEFLRSRKFSRIKYTPPKKLIRSRTFHALCRRLELNMDQMITDDVLPAWQKNESALDG